MEFNINQFCYRLTSFLSEGFGQCPLLSGLLLLILLMGCLVEYYPKDVGEDARLTLVLENNVSI